MSPEGKKRTPLKFGLSKYSKDCFEPQQRGLPGKAVISGLYYVCKRLKYCTILLIVTATNQNRN